MIAKTLQIEELKLESGAALSDVVVHYHQAMRLVLQVEKKKMASKSFVFGPI